MDSSSYGDSSAPLLDTNQAQQRAVSKRTGKKKSTLLTVCPYILGNELCERLAYYGLATNLVTYITQVLGGDPAFAAIMVAVFEGTCYTTPIIGALLADSVWGRYKTILVFSSIYLMGVLLLTFSSMVPDDGTSDTANPIQFALLFGSLGVISLGTGGIKPNVSAFGADQFNEADPQDRREKESFFNWFYLAINVGSLIACTVIVYIQDQVSWTIGFAIPGIAMFSAIMLFYMGRQVYRHVLPTESPMTRVVKVVAAAVQNRWRKSHTPDVSVAPRQVDTSSAHGGGLYKQAVLQGASAHGGSAYQDDSTRSGSRLMQLPSSMSYRWLEDAVTEWETSQGQLVQAGGGLAGYTPQQVEEVKLVLRLLPVFAATVLYWTIYTQMSTLFVQQGNLMNRDLKWDGAYYGRIPSASMSIFNTLSIIVLIWVYDSVIEPALKRTQRFRMTLLRRQGWGMLVAAIAMVYAAWLEMWRLQIAHDAPCPEHCESAAVRAASAASQQAHTWMPPPPDAPAGPKQCLCANEPADISIFWQAPEYFLIGLSEVLTSIGQLEFFYDQAPDVMRSCSMALCLLSTAIGSYLAGALTWGVQVVSPRITGQQWLPRDLNQGRMDLFFWLMAGLMVFNLFAFLGVALNYTYKQVEHKRAVHSTYGNDDIPGTEHIVSYQAPSPAMPSPSAPLSIGPRGAAQDVEEQAEGEELPADMEIYARSLAYQPTMPTLPAPFR